MFSSDQMTEYIDWFHGPLKNSEEKFNHKGSLLSFFVEPKFTIGVSNYWNITISQKIGHRQMTWKTKAKSIHHRNEGTSSNFQNALGGFLGDAKISANYLIFNDGQGVGKRFYIGCGLIIPSKNTLTSDPFFLSNEQKTEHRHFSLSEGSYKNTFETQYFIKRNTNPVFIGGVFSITKPIKENQYGFKSSTNYDFSFTGFSKKIKKLNTSIGTNISVQHNTEAFWNGKKAPNSKSTIIVLGGGAAWDFSHNGLTFNIRFPIFLEGGFNEDIEEINQEIKALQFSVGYRKIFDWTIPWIDPLKDL